MKYREAISIFSRHLSKIIGGYNKTTLSFKMTVSVTLVLFMVVAVALLFTSMVLSAMASSNAKKAENAGSNATSSGYADKAHKYSMWSAIVCGVAVFVIAIIVIVYIYISRHEIAQGAAGIAHGAGNYLGSYGNK